MFMTPVFMSDFKSRWGPLRTGIVDALVYLVADSPGELISMSILWLYILKGFSGLDSTHLLRYPRKSFSPGNLFIPLPFQGDLPANGKVWQGFNDYPKQLW